MLEDRIGRLERGASRGTVIAYLFAVSLVASFIVWWQRIGQLDGEELRRKTDRQVLQQQFAGSTIDSSSVSIANLGDFKFDPHVAWRVSSTGAAVEVGAGDVRIALATRAEQSASLSFIGRVASILEVDTRTGEWRFERYRLDRNGAPVSAVLSIPLVAPMGATRSAHAD